MERRRIYGISEIAEAVGARPETVAQWRFRGLLPPPTEDLAMGPAWLPADIERWIEARLAADADHREDG